MARYRTPSANSKYYVEKELFLTTVHFCRQYPVWLAELSDIPSGGVSYDSERVQTSPSPDKIANLAIRRAEISKKKDKVEHVAQMVADDLAQWIIKGVCYGLTYYQLQEMGIPCGKDLYYKLRRLFYFEMSKRI